MNNQEILSTYELIADYHKNYLEKKGAILPKLKNNGAYTKDALVLVFLARNYPKTKIVKKQELTRFIQGFFPDTNDVQQARHLGAQKGFYIISGTRGDKNIKSGSYQLKTLKEAMPNFNSNRRKGFSGDFESIKAKYDYRCATCGSKEEEKHFIEKSIITTLQQGHMDPSKELKEGNIIPQCQFCNRADRNRWVYDAKGRVVEIAISEDGKRRVECFLQKAKKSKSKIFSEIVEFLLQLNSVKK